MIAEGGNIFNNSAKKQKELNAFYTGLASDMGADPQDVVGGIGDIQMANIEQQAPVQQKQTGGLMGLLEYGKRALGGNLAIQQQPQTTGEKLAMLAGPLGVAVTRPDIATETIGPALESILYGKLFGKKILSAGKKVLSPRSTIATARSAAVEKAPKFLEPAKKELLKEGQDIVRQFPGAKGEWAKNTVDQIKGAKTETEFLNMLDSWGRKAFPKGGGVKSAHAADLYSNLTRVVKSVLEKNAPESMKNQALLRLLRQGPRVASQTAWQAAKIGAATKLLGF